MIEPWKPPGDEAGQRAWLLRFDPVVDFWTPERKDIAGWVGRSSKPMAASVLSAFPNGLDPSDIRRTFAANPKLAIAATIAWGYRKSPRRMGRLLGITGSGDLGKVASSIQALQNKRASARAIAGVLKVRGIGISTVSKLACLAGLEAEEGRCLVFDDLVRIGVHKVMLPELMPLRAATSRTGASYGVFVRTANDAADRLGVDPIAIEQCAFRLGARRPWGVSVEICRLT